MRCGVKSRTGWLVTELEKLKAENERLQRNVTEAQRDLVKLARIERYAEKLEAECLELRKYYYRATGPQGRIVNRRNQPRGARVI